MKKTASQPSNPPAASLFAANLAYCQRLATLAQESQGRWAALAQQIWRDHASQYQATLAPWPRRKNGRRSRPQSAISRATNGRHA
ncbi:hypothetical protein D555_3464 [Bordetella holmesii 35009]|nr:hypothetical protein D555_3464 [Bordetella holmesii 35009]